MRLKKSESVSDLDGDATVVIETDSWDIIGSIFTIVDRVNNWLREKPVCG